MEEIYQIIYGSRGLTGNLVVAAKRNLVLHLDKLQLEEKIFKDSDGKYFKSDLHKI